ncbi:MAG TPA: GNAT family N-acetyltransferase [Candidatus Eisenbergiella stercoravium]|nr:GNAT family N-acetyltransferase [Candidatus Eisenbergiella stercoravium]
MDGHDMIVNLKNIEYHPPEDPGLKIKRAFAGDKEIILRFVRENFSESWAGEAECAILQAPSQCFIATEQGKVLGFACFDVSAKGFFGPIGVLESERGRQIGKYLLLKTLDAMRSAGYGYAIIGWVGDAEGFYRKTVHAEVIPDSSPENSVYANLVRMP